MYIYIYIYEERDKAPLDPPEMLDFALPPPARTVLGVIWGRGLRGFRVLGF